MSRATLDEPARRRQADAAEPSRDEVGPVGPGDELIAQAPARRSSNQSRDVSLSATEGHLVFLRACLDLTDQPLGGRGRGAPVEVDQSAPKVWVFRRERPAKTQRTAPQGAAH